MLNVLPGRLFSKSCLQQHPSFDFLGGILVSSFPAQQSWSFADVVAGDEFSPRSIGQKDAEIDRPDMPQKTRSARKRPDIRNCRRTRTISILTRLLHNHFMTALLLALTLQTPEIVEVTPPYFAEAKEPQLAIDSDYSVYCAFGKGNAIYVCKSTDRGKTYGTPILVSDKGKLSLGMRRGPRITAWR